MGGEGSVPIKNPNLEEHKTIQIIKPCTFEEIYEIQLTDEAENFFKQQQQAGNKIKLLVMAGIPGIGKSTLLNLVCKHYLYQNYEGKFPQIFNIGTECNNKTIFFDMLLVPIVIKNETYYLVDAEGFNGLFGEDQHAKRKELLNKLFSLMYFFSDSFIVNWKMRFDKNHLNILKEIIKEGDKLKELEIGKHVVYKDKFINNKVIIFIRNKNNLDEKEKKDLLDSGYNQSYPIKEIPKDFRENNIFKNNNDKKMIDCLESIDNAFSDISKSYKGKDENRRRDVFFDFNKFKLYLNIINKRRNKYDELALLYLPSIKHYVYFRENHNNNEGYPDILTEKSKKFYRELIFRLLLNNTEAVSKAYKNKKDPHELDETRKAAWNSFIENEPQNVIESFDNNFSYVDDSIEKIILENSNFGKLIQIIDKVFNKFKTEYIPFRHNICFELDINPEIIENDIPELIKNKINGKDFWFSLIIVNCCLFSKSDNSSYNKKKDLIKKFLRWAENWALQHEFKIEDLFLLLPKIRSTLKSIFKKIYTLEFQKSQTLLSIEKVNNENLDKIIIKINEDIIQKLQEKSGQVKVITLTGKPGIGKSTLLNSLIYNSKYKHFQGVYPQFFQAGSSTFSETLGIKINMTEIGVGDFERVILIDTEGFGAVRENEDIDEDIYLKVLEKIYGVLMLLSDCFILFLENRYEQSDIDLVTRMKNIGRFIQRSRNELQNIDEINMENFFVFKNNTDFINTDNERRHWGTIKKNIEDFIFPIIEIPKEFRDTNRSSLLFNSQYSHHLNGVFTDITNQLNEKRNKFSIEELNIFINILNDDNLEFSDIIRLQSLIKKIKEKSKEKFMEINKKYPSIINEYNKDIIFEEIVKEVSDDIAAEEFENLQEREKILRSLNNPQSTNNTEISDNDKLAFGISTSIKENPNMLPELSKIRLQENISQIRPQNQAIVKDMLTFHNQEIVSIQKVIRTDGHTGTFANLKNGETFLIHKSGNGQVVATDAFNLSNNWKLNGKVENINNIKITDMIRNGQQDKYLNNNNIKASEYEIFQKNNNNVNVKNGLNPNAYVALSASGGFVGSLLANIIMGQYKGKSGWTITGEIALGAGITTSVVAISKKIPCIGWIVAGVVLGFQGKKTFANKNVKCSSRFENAGKIVVNAGLGTGLAVGGAEVGAAIGAFGGPIGLGIGVFVGGLLGGIAGSLAGHGINKIWKIVNPDKAFDILRQELSEYGYWIRIEVIFEVLKIDHENFNKEKPIFFDKFLNYRDEPYNRLNGDIVWGNVVLLNVLSMLRSFNGEKYSTRSEIIGKKVNKFLKSLNMKNFNFNTYQNENINLEYDGEKLKVKDHLDSIDKVIGSWTNIAK